MSFLNRAGTLGLLPPGTPAWYDFRDEAPLGKGPADADPFPETTLAPPASAEALVFPGPGVTHPDTPEGEVGDSSPGSPTELETPPLTIGDVSSGTCKVAARPVIKEESWVRVGVPLRLSIRVHNC